MYAKEYVGYNQRNRSQRTNKHTAQCWVNSLALKRQDFLILKALASLWQGVKWSGKNLQLTSESGGLPWDLHQNVLASGDQASRKAKRNYFE